MYFALNNKKNNNNKSLKMSIEFIHPMAWFPSISVLLIWVDETFMRSVKNWKTQIHSYTDFNAYDFV